MGWSEEMAESQSKRVEGKEKVEKRQTAESEGQNQLGDRGLCLGFSLHAGPPSLVSLWPKAGEGLVKELCKNSAVALAASAGPGGCSTG